MRRAAVVVGMGEMGGVFARGFLRDARTVVPALRNSDLTQLAAELADPAVVLVAVGEAQLHDVLAEIPAPWRDRLALLQNELLARDWERHGLDTPTLAVVWFEKKPGREVKVILPTPLYGPAAGVLAAALESLGIPCRILGDAAQLRFELVRKNLYILVSNIAGLEVGGDVGGLWDAHRDLALTVADEVLAIQEWLTGTPPARDALIDGMVEAFRADPAHRCTGRSAPGRLARAMAHADQAGLDVPRLRAIGARNAGT